MKNNKTYSEQRRSFLKKTMLGGLLTTSGGLFTMSCEREEKTAKAVSKPFHGIVTRRDIGSLSSDDAGLQILKDAVGVLQKRSSRNQLDPAGWYAHAVQHSMFCFTNEFERQIHFTWLFYPWHRAFLYFLERKLQEAVNEPSLALHYWDWTKSPFIPEAYWGKDNPLNDRTRMATPKDRIPDDYLNIESNLRTPHFKAFGGYPKDTPDKPFGEGVVEQSTHNNIHNWIGGNMDNFATAATDPIFTGHHGNIDRIWDAWLAADPGHKNPSDPKFLNYVFDLTDAFGYPTKIKVSETLNSENLGYKFEDLSFEKTYKGGKDHLRPSGNKPVAVMPIQIPDDQRVLMASAVKEGFNRVVMKFERLSLPFIPICVRVYVHEQGQNISTDVNEVHYVTTATILPVGVPNKAVPEKTVIMQTELGPYASDLLASGKKLAATFEPVNVPGRPPVTGTVTMENVSIAFENEADY